MHINILPYARTAPQKRKQMHLINLDSVSYLSGESVPLSEAMTPGGTIRVKKSV